jgi:hypothetical protein
MLRAIWGIGGFHVVDMMSPRGVSTLNTSLFISWILCWRKSFRGKEKPCTLTECPPGQLRGSFLQCVKTVFDENSLAIVPHSRDSPDLTPFDWRQGLGGLVCRILEVAMKAIGRNKGPSVGRGRSRKSHLSHIAAEIIDSPKIYYRVTTRRAHASASLRAEWPVLIALPSCHEKSVQSQKNGLEES